MTGYDNVERDLCNVFNVFFAADPGYKFIRPESSKKMNDVNYLTVKALSHNQIGRREQTKPDELGNAVVRANWSLSIEIIAVGDSARSFAMQLAWMLSNSNNLKGFITAKGYTVNSVDNSLDATQLISARYEKRWMLQVTITTLVQFTEILGSITSTAIEITDNEEGDTRIIEVSV